MLDFLVFLPDEMLAKVDRMTMGASLEGRCPLLDVALVEYMAGLSFRTKVPGFRQRDLKHVLRAAVGDLLPVSLLSRPKHGFDVPLDAWFERAGDPYIDGVLNPARIRARGVFDPAAVSELLARHRQRETRAGTRLYSLLVFEEWAEATL
jgi:asparagine synthase (glutamine-hydrolysing)